MKDDIGHAGFSLGPLSVRARGVRDQLHLPARRFNPWVCALGFGGAGTLIGLASLGAESDGADERVGPSLTLLRYIHRAVGVRSFMAETSSTLTRATHDTRLSLREGVYRYFFYGWLFRDATRGSGLERAVALRHNQDQARWLPLYMLRWTFVGVATWALETVSEHAPSSAVLSAALAVAFVLVVLYQFVTVTCWLFLRGVDRPR